MAYSSWLRNSRCYDADCKPPQCWNRPPRQWNLSLLKSKREKNKRQDPGDAMLEKHWKGGQAKRLRRKEGNQEKSNLVVVAGVSMSRM